jgi:dephospho-CoA kinase
LPTSSWRLRPPRRPGSSWKNAHRQEADAVTGTRPLIIGLTGPIGCGKSSVARWLEEAGGVRIDADDLARQLSEPGEPALDAIRERFGPAVAGPGGSLDRAALAGIVFSDAAALRDLERIVHPVVRSRIEALVDDAVGAGSPFVVIEAIKLVESGLARTCDEVWLVECSPGTQHVRLMGRGADAADAARRIAAQSGIVERLRPAATRVIDADGSPAEVRERALAALGAALRGRTGTKPG